MPKQKIETIQVGKIHGDKQEVRVNDKLYEFKWSLSPNTIIEKLSNIYEFDWESIKEVEERW